MRATQVVAPGRLEIVESSKPELQPGHVLVRTKQVSLCGSDYHSIHFSAPHAYPLPVGTSGHEMVGVVEAVGSENSSIRVGDLALALAPDNRAMAEYYLAKEEHVLVLPNGQPLDHLLQAQQLGTIIYACKHLPSPVLDKDVVVIGQGSAGLWWDWMMRRLGARSVIAVDLQAHRLAAAGHYGATHTVHNAQADAIEGVREILRGELPDVVIEAAGEADSIRLAVNMVKRHGSILFFGVPRLSDMEFPFSTFFRKCVLSRTIVGATSDPNQSCTRLAIDLIARGEANVAPMITHHFPFEQVLDAYELQATRDEGAIKIVVDMPA
jgi:threonine dehydrogenase-like Zn-dependent dehydrogenase